jgi:hypothetical protein
MLESRVGAASGLSEGGPPFRARSRASPAPLTCDVAQDHCSEGIDHRCERDGSVGRDGNAGLARVGEESRHRARGTRSQSEGEQLVDRQDDLLVIRNETKAPNLVTQLRELGRLSWECKLAN